MRAHSRARNQIDGHTVEILRPKEVPGCCETSMQGGVFVDGSEILPPGLLRERVGFVFEVYILKKKCAGDQPRIHSDSLIYPIQALRLAHLSLFVKKKKADMALPFLFFFFLLFFSSLLFFFPIDDNDNALFRITTTRLCTTGNVL